MLEKLRCFVLFWYILFFFTIYISNVNKYMRGVFRRELLFVLNFCFVLVLNFEVWKFLFWFDKFWWGLGWFEWCDVMWENVSRLFVRMIIWYKLRGACSSKESYCEQNKRKLPADGAIYCFFFFFWWLMLSRVVLLISFFSVWMLWCDVPVFLYCKYKLYFVFV